MVHFKPYNNNSAAVISEAEEDLLEPCFTNSIVGVFISTNTSLRHEDVTIGYRRVNDEEVHMFWPPIEEQDRFEEFKLVDVSRYYGVRLPGTSIRPDEMEVDLVVRWRPKWGRVRTKIARETLEGIEGLSKLRRAD